MTSKKRGFAAMSREKHRQISSAGGRAAHALGLAHEFTSEEARILGRLGGEVVSRDSKYMAEIGRRGGQAWGRKRREAAERRRAKFELSGTYGK